MILPEDRHLHARGPVEERELGCPACGHYLSREDSPAAQKPLWIIVGAIICLLIIVLWAVWGTFV